MMERVFLVEQVRNIDKKAISDDISVGYGYMQKAGRGIFNVAKKIVPNPTMGEIAVICGKGNNGGDGYVAARLLIENGYKVMCFSLVSPEEIKGEALLAYNEFISTNGNVMVLDDVEDLNLSPSRYSLIIDAILGTGLQGNPHGLYAAVIEAINRSQIPILSVDTPSGLNNNTGNVANPCVKAHTTIVMGFPRPGLYFYPGRKYVGEIVVEHLEYPEVIVSTEKPLFYIPGIDYFKKVLPLRKPDGSKFDHGVLLIVGGSTGMTGSVTLTSKAALKSGCGMVHCAFPSSLLSILSVKLTEPVLHPLPDTDKGVVSLDAVSCILELAEKVDAMCIGPGLSHEASAIECVREIISKCKIPILLDADGLNAFRDNVNELKKHKGELVITPHIGEWKRLFGELPAMPSERIVKVKEIAEEFNLTILLKGNPTIICNSKGESFLMPYGNSSLAKAGSGDVLSGIISSLMVQGASIKDATILGAYIHGRCGEILSKVKTEYSVLASDLIEAIPEILKTLIEQKWER